MIEQTGVIPVPRQAYTRRGDGLRHAGSGGRMESIHERAALEMNLLPPGPIWLLHAFYLVTTALMLAWYLRYEWRPGILKRFQVKTMVSEPISQSIPHSHAPVHTP